MELNLNKLLYDHLTKNQDELLGNGLGLNSGRATVTLQ